MNSVIYARFSSHAQTEQSIEGQLKVCYEYAKNNGFTVLSEYIDRALTGTNDNRPQFKKILRDSDKRKFEAIIVYQLDRFSRSREDSAVSKAKLKKNGVKVVSAKENISEDASGVLIESVLEGMAEYYSKELSQKVLRGMSINADKCKSLGSYTPFGYKVKIMRDKKKKAPAQARAKEEYLLTTKLYCGLCKDMLVGTGGTSHTGAVHTYYTCKNVLHKKGCKKKTVKKNWIENLVVAECMKQLTDGNINAIAMASFSPLYLGETDSVCFFYW